VKEIAGRATNTPRIIEYLKTAKHLATLDDLTTVTNADGKKEEQKTGYKMSQVDETAW
jgi:hypothetical protein